MFHFEETLFWEKIMESLKKEVIDISDDETPILVKKEIRLLKSPEIQDSNNKTISAQVSSKSSQKFLTFN